MKRDKSSNEEAERFRKENARLKKEIDELKRVNEKLRKEKDSIEDEFERYKMRHPDTVGVKSGKVYAITMPVRRKSCKKPGARLGHEPFFRKKPEHIDREVLVPVAHCPHCGGSNLSETVQDIRTRTIEEIPVCQPIVTRYEIERRYCRNCKKIVEAAVPVALSGSRIGIRAMLFVVWLKIGLRLPKEAIPKLLQEAYGLTISEGEVQCILSQVAEAFGPTYDRMVQDMRERPARNMDETTWRINGQNAWLWVFVTKWEAIYDIASTRGHEAALKMLGENPKGTDVHDRFSAYKTLAVKTGNRPQQYCWAHILADSKELTQFYGDEGRHIHKTLKKTYKKATGFNHDGTDEDVEHLYQELTDNLDRTYKSSHCYKFVKNLLGQKDALFQFVTNQDVEATNNAAERAIRHSVVARKISGGSRSTTGARTYSLLMTLLRTLSIRNQNILTDGPTILLTSHG